MQDFTRLRWKAQRGDSDDRFCTKAALYEKQLQEFRQKNIVDGRFVTDEQTIQSVEDLEKLLFCGRRKRMIRNRRKRCILMEN